MNGDIQGQRGKNRSLKADVRIDGYDQRDLLQLVKLCGKTQDFHWIKMYKIMCP